MWHFSGSPHMWNLQQCLRTSHDCIHVFLLALVVAASWDCIDNDTSKWPCCTAPDVRWVWSTGGKITGWGKLKYWLSNKKLFLCLPVCPLQVLHKWHQVWTKVSHIEKAVATWQRCVVVVMRHKYQLKYNSIHFYCTGQAHLFYICGRLGDNTLCFCHSSMSGFMRDLVSGTKFNCSVHDLQHAWGNKKWLKKFWSKLV
jgi:hypothetical protein